jgi:hypothetical protein
MAKSKHAKPDEFQKEQIRHLKKELKRRDQKIRQLEKELGYSQNKDTSPRKEKQRDPELCSHCGKGELTVMDIGVRRYEICNLCKDRKRIE